MFIVYSLLAVLALVGHTALWTTIINQLHATRLPKPGIKLVNLIGLGSLCVLPLVYAWRILSLGGEAFELPAGSASQALPQWYLFACVALSFVALPMWLRNRLRPAPHVLRREQGQRYDMVERLGHAPMGKGLSRYLTRLPGNECFQLELSEKELEIPRLASPLDGLTISHLSDVHFTGAIDKRFFVEVMELTNQLESDVILITGDLVDKADCIDWVPDTFGRLRARYGVYVIFGNHDVRLKSHISRLRERLIDCGLHYLGASWTRIEADQTNIYLAGNELPWIKPAADLRGCPPRREDPSSLKILLSHSPDQFAWARQRDFDLMLAGHNHGGQIQLPVIGPLFSPSRYGVRYANGTFYSEPTVMHVSRGISALDPLRYNCPPELARLVLRSPHVMQSEQVAITSHQLATANRAYSGAPADR